MATMYSLFFFFVFNNVWFPLGFRDSVIDNLILAEAASGSYFLSLYQGRDFHFFLDEKTKQKNQGLVARLNCLYISYNQTNSPDLSGSNRSDCFTEIEDNSLRLAQPRPIEMVGASSSLQVRLMSLFSVISTVVERSTGFLGKLTNNAVRPIRLHFVPLPVKWSGHSTVTGGVRDRIINIASAELGVREETGQNDGPRVEQYLRYTNLGKGHQWCASFVSYCYGKTGLAEPRNPWSPALFPRKRTIAKEKAQPADVFGIYGAKEKRINHVGLVKELQGGYIVSVEGNSNNRVESRRRHLRTVYAMADWVK